MEIRMILNKLLLKIKSESKPVFI